MSCLSLLEGVFFSFPAGTGDDVSSGLFVVRTVASGTMKNCRLMAVRNNTTAPRRMLCPRAPGPVVPSPVVLGRDGQRRDPRAV